jgi:hypothetical protein
MYDGEFNHGGGSGGCGGPTARRQRRWLVEAVEDNLSAKAAGNESVDGRMTACDDEIGRWTTTQQPTNERRRGGGGNGGGSSAIARGRQLLGGGAAAAHSAKVGSAGGGSATS